MEALNLVEHAKTFDDDKKRGIVELFASASDILRAIPFQTVTGGAFRYNEQAALPGIAFRRVNEAFTPSHAVINPRTEALFIAGGDLDVDKALIRWHGEGRRAIEEEMQITSIAATWTDTVFFGDNTSNPEEFDGLYRRVGLSSSRTFHNSTDSIVDATTAPLSLGQLDIAIGETNRPTHIIMNRKLHSRLPAAARDLNIGNVLTTDKDAMGMPIMKYAGYPILQGYEPDLHPSILPFTEAGQGGGNALCSSIWVVGMREGGFSGLQSQAMDPRDLGELDDKPVERTRIEWDIGIAIENGFSVTRLSSITDAAIVK